MDARSIARSLVEEIGNTLDRHIHPRTGELVPPRIHGRRPVPDAKCGEDVVDHLDELVDAAMPDWALDREPAVSLELLQIDGRWTVEWAIETGEAGETAEAGPEGEGD